MRYLYGDAAKGSTYDSSYCERAVVLQSVRSVWTDKLCVVHFGEGGSYKLQGLGNTPKFISNTPHTGYHTVNIIFLILISL